MQQVAIAGASGNLGHRIVKALLRRGARPIALVRQETDREKIDEIQRTGAEVRRVDYGSRSGIADAIRGAACVISAVQGFHDTLVKGQSLLLDATIDAGVGRFIPSDFSADFRAIPHGQNRNFDFRKEFKTIVDGAKIQATSIFNGTFAEVLTYNSPLLDVRNHQAAFWREEGWKVDFTTMDDTAAYAAAVALDENAPRDLKIASFQANAWDLAAAASRVFGSDFKTVNRGPLSDLADAIKRMRAEDPAGEAELYPRWQDMMYVHSIFSVHHDKLDNSRYTSISWTTLEAFLEGMTASEGVPNAS